jgi:hypothetical protein
MTINPKYTLNLAAFGSGQKGIRGQAGKERPETSQQRSTDTGSGRKRRREEYRVRPCPGQPVYLRIRGQAGNGKEKTERKAGKENGVRPENMARKYINGLEIVALTGLDGT